MDIPTVFVKSDFSISFLDVLDVFLQLLKSVEVLVILVLKLLVFAFEVKLYGR